MALHRGLALLVAGAFFMEILDGTVIAPAAPHIAADLGVAPVDVNVAITAYVLTLGVLIPVSGWLADRFGGRRVFCVALAVFVLASAGCALAPDLGALTAARVVQGAGGAMMVPVGRLVVLRTTAKTDLVRAIAYLTWPALLAPVLAPAVGGVLAEYASWRWIFVINVPLGVAALVVALRIVPGLRAEAPPPLDRGGFVLTAIGVAALIVGLEGLGSGFSATTIAALAAAVLGVGLAVRHLLRATRPLVDLRILRVATYRVTAASGSVYRAVITAVPFLLPLLFQVGFGWSAAQAGAVVIALFVGNVAIKPATTPMMRRFGIRTVLLASIAVGAACLVAMAFLQPTTPLPLLLALLLVSGIARSTGFTAYNSVAFADVEPERMNHANTLLSTLQELGAGLGVAVAALLVRLGEAVPVAAGAAGPYRVAFVLLAVVLAVPAVSALLLDRAAGDAVTGR
ncbi:MFS transporter [Pseudonocardia kujensis]|uniref:MFS transporter n=1 Tax=Pseudonocardia kujensis TaxID=1128675 RepID=UPI001E536330|nr:MFS transporter [Pseudonocardia kujensis]MCE0766206.1 MFS transporter [Pseudonocardia kujensis]